MTDGSKMERELWSEFTISDCSPMYEPLYSHRVSYNPLSDEASLCITIYRNGSSATRSIALEQETLAALFNLDILSLEDREAANRVTHGISVTDLSGNLYIKNLSEEKKKEILSILAPCIKKAFDE